MKIKSAAVLGAGAVGSYPIWGLCGLKDLKFGVIAKGERAEKLKADGCTINGEVYRPKVWTPEEACGVDLLIVSLKYGALRGALEDIRVAVGENTIVMSLMNGVDSEEIISECIDREHIIYSLIKIASHREGEGYCFDPEHTIGIIFGEAEAPYDTERMHAVEELFRESRLNYVVTEHIREAMWVKYRLNVTGNLGQAILGSGVGCYRDSEHMKAISDGLKNELEAIAKAKGIDLDLVEPSLCQRCSVPTMARYSTLQDLDAKRHTEIDMFSGTLMRYGRELGIPTPYNDYTYHMIKALEEKNDGKFEYENRENDFIDAQLS